MTKENKPYVRFQDQKHRLEDYQTEVAVVCPKCQKKALSKVEYALREAKLFCEHCGYYKNKTTQMSYLGIINYYQMAAHCYFDANLWYSIAYKNHEFFAYNLPHLLYLEQYITAKLRERKNRSHFTLIEKLPLFYHQSKNRKALLKLIQKLKTK